MNPDPFADAQKDAHDLAHGNFGSLGGQPKGPAPIVIRIQDKVKPTKTASRPAPTKKLITNLQRPLKNPELIGKGANGIPQKAPPTGKVVQRSAARIPQATQGQAKAVRPMQGKQPKSKGQEKDRTR